MISSMLDGKVPLTNEERNKKNERLGKGTKTIDTRREEWKLKEKKEIGIYGTR